MSINPTAANSFSAANNAASSRGPSAPPAEHTVRRGDTMWGIANSYGVSLQALKNANPNLNPNLIFPGNKVNIPGGATQKYEIQRGDTLDQIAQKFGTTAQALQAANPGVIRNINRIYPGDNIAIPAGGNANGGSRGETISSTRPVAKPESVGGNNAVSAERPVARPSSDLRAMFDPAKGSNAPAAIIIGNAEGTRTPSGGMTNAYAGHIDPGNSKSNRGSFSYQHGTPGMTAAQADAAQLTKLSRQIPTFEAAAKNAGLDPNNQVLATAYFDLFNQSESAAGRFLNQIGYLKDAGISNQSVTELRFRSFVDVSTGDRFVAQGKNGPYSVGGGFANIAERNLEKRGIHRSPTEAEVQQVIRADQTRRQNAMDRAIQAQDAASPTIDATRPVPRPATGRVDGNAIAKEHGVIVKSDAVRISRLDANMAPVIAAVAQAADKLGLPTPVITSGNDSRHKSGSLHYADKGLDFRGNNISDAQGVALQNEVRRILGDRYDVIFEIFPKNSTNDHLHVEYDPN